MKNLKKVLALVLALATVFGLGISASAQYTDDSSIKYTEAVEVMSMIDVLGGNPDGSFNPQGNLTRAQAAKMVSYLLNGGKDVNDLYAGSNTFTDCYNSWAKGYIAYVNQTGVVSGVGNGKFNPDGTLTGVALAKMMLTSLGYDADAEGYQKNNNWQVNILDDAQSAGLLKGMNGVNLYTAITREQAAQMMFNALKATMVKYDNKGSEIILPGGGSIVTNPSSAEEVVNKDFDYRGNKSDTKTPVDEVMQLCEKYFADLKFADAPSGDDFGRPASQWTYKVNNKTEKVVVAKTAELTYTDAVKGSDLKEDLKDAGLTAANGTVIVRNGGNNGSFDLATFVEGKTSEGGPGTVIELYADADGKVNKIVVTATYLAEIKTIKENRTDADKNYITIAPIGTGKSTITIQAGQKVEGFDNIYKNAKEGDYILVTPKGDNSSSDEVLTMAIPEVVTGTKTASGDNYVKVGDTKYTLSDTFEKNDSTFSNTCDFYLDTYGNVIGAVEVEAGEENLSYLYVNAVKAVAGDDKGFDEGYVQLRVSYLDGTSAILEYETKTASKTTAGADNSVNVEEGKLYVTFDGKNYGLTTQGVKELEKVLTADFYSYTTNTDGLVTVKPTKADKAADSKTLYVKAGEARVYVAEKGDVLGVADANTVLNVVKDGKTSTYTGYKNFPTQTFDGNINVLVTYKNDSKAISSIYVLGGEVETSTTYAYAIGKGDNTADGQFYRFWVDGEEVQYIVDDADAVKAGKIYDLKINGNKATPEDITSSAKGTDTVVTSVGDNYFVFKADGKDAYAYYADDVKVYDVTDSGNIIEGNIRVDDKVTYFENKDGKVVIAYITGVQG